MTRARSPASDNLIITIASCRTHTTTPCPSWDSNRPYSATPVERSSSQVPESSPGAAAARLYSPWGPMCYRSICSTPHLAPPISRMRRRRRYFFSSLDLRICGRTRRMNCQVPSLSAKPAQHVSASICVRLKPKITAAKPRVARFL